MEILKCKCGAYLTEDKLVYVVDYQQTLSEPEQGHYACPQCGKDSDDMEELGENEIIELLNSK